MYLFVCLCICVCVFVCVRVFAYGCLCVCACVSRDAEGPIMVEAVDRGPHHSTSPGKQASISETSLWGNSLYCSQVGSEGRTGETTVNTYIHTVECVCGWWLV